MKKFKIDQVKKQYHIEASSKEEALKLFEEQKDDIYIKDTEWVENEIEEMNISK